MNRGMRYGLLVAGAVAIAMFAYRPAGAAEDRLPSSLAAESAAKAETALGDLVAESLKLAAKADVAVIPAGMLVEKPLPGNASTPNALRQVLTAPTEPVVTVKVTGKQLQAALERSVSLAPRKNLGFLQVAGLTMVYDAARPENNRVLEVKVGGETLKPDKTYTLAMPDSLAHGALGYFKFWDDKTAKPVTDAKGAKITLVDALAARLKAGKPPAGTDNRIKSK